MGVNLYNTKDKAITLAFSWVTYVNILKLAYVFGWDPHGTTMPDERNKKLENKKVWNGTYTLNS